MPPDISDWTKHQVRDWALRLDDVDNTDAEVQFKQNISGHVLLLLDTTDLSKMGVTYGLAEFIIHVRDKIVKIKGTTSSASQPGRQCQPYPLCRYHDTCRYMESSILDNTESGASDLIEPYHEYKGFNNTPQQSQMIKFADEVIGFAAACMNSQTNSTIHFGIGDQPNFPHGQVVGVFVKDKKAYDKALRHAIDECFEYKHKEAAKRCIRPVRFVGVLNKDMT